MVHSLTQETWIFDTPVVIEGKPFFFVVNTQSGKARVFVGGTKTFSVCFQIYGRCNL